MPYPNPGIQPIYMGYTVCQLRVSLTKTEKMKTISKDFLECFQIGAA